MKLYAKKIFLVISAVILFAGCGSPAKSQGKAARAKPLLLVSIPPYQSLVRQIAGDGFEVATIVPPNADPHTYEPTVRQFTEIAEGKLWFRIGEPFEGKLLGLLKKTESLDLRLGLTMIEETPCHHGHTLEHVDRHIWLSPKMVAEQIRAISASLESRFPNEKEGFAKRAASLSQELETLDQEIAERLQSTDARTFLISHPAFAYFCRDYQCRQLSVEQEGKEPRPKELEKILASAIASGAHLAIAIPQHNNKGAQLIAGKLRIPVRFIDPYAEDCMDTMRKLAGLIANPFEADGP